MSFSLWKKKCLIITRFRVIPAGSFSGNEHWTIWAERSPHVNHIAFRTTQTRAKNLALFPRHPCQNTQTHRRRKMQTLKAPNSQVVPGLENENTLLINTQFTKPLQIIIIISAKLILTDHTFLQETYRMSLPCSVCVCWGELSPELQKCDTDPWTEVNSMD